MKRYCLKLQFIILVIFLQCSSPAQKESENTGDTTAVASVPESVPVEEIVSEEQVSDEPQSASIELDEFTKYPFASDYPYIKNFLRGEGIAFTIIAEDTMHSESRIIEFDSSRISFLDSDERFQEELGDLICSSDIKSPKFLFNQGVAIGMPQEEFLTIFTLTETSLTKDSETGSYLENKVSWGEDEGYWKVTFWFSAGLLVRVQSEISPCYYDYGD